MGDNPRCWLCKREDVILDGLYTRVDFGGRIELCCDDCSEKADPEPWVAHLEVDGHDFEVEVTG